MTSRGALTIMDAIGSYASIMLQGRGLVLP
jgi:hypothetical protein